MLFLLLTLGSVGAQWPVGLQGHISTWALYQYGDAGAVAASSSQYAIGKTSRATFDYNEDTIFEIGSCTKVVTALLATLLEGEGKLSLDAPISTYLPASVNMPTDVTRITLRQLASHMSGLPNMPSNIQEDWSNPNMMANYTEQDFYSYLATARLSNPGKYLYSNTGSGLLGWICVLVGGQSYEQLVQQYIGVPLSMSDTTAQTLSADQLRRLAPGMNNGQYVGTTNFQDAFVGAGGIRSTARDMQKFVRAFNGLVTVTPAMRSAMDQTLQSQGAGSNPGWSIGLSWDLFWQGSSQVKAKDGLTTGYNSFMALKNNEVVVILSNTAGYANSAVTKPGMDFLNEVR